MKRTDLALVVCLTSLLLAGQTGMAQTILLSESGQEEVLGRMSHFVDPEGALSFEEIRSKAFKPLQRADKSPSFGFDRNTHWFRFSLINSTNQNEWLLEIPYAPLDKIDLYVETGSGGWAHQQSGDLFPVRERDLPHRHTIFRIEVEPGLEREIYIRIQTISSVQAPILLWTAEAFQIASYETQLINGLFYGAMFIMILYQLFLFFSIRDRTTLYYVLTLISMANVIGFFQGYTFLFLYPNSPGLNDDWAALTGPLYVLCSALLTRSFLKIKQFSRTLDTLLIVNTTLNLIAGILMVFFIRQISYKFLHLFVISHSIIVLSSAAFVLYRKYKPALYYLLAWATLLIAAVVFTMGNLGLAPGYLGTNYQGLMIGCVLQVLLIALALGERWNVLVRENQQAKELELKRNQQENERLEREVRLRTLEIQQQKEKLEELNQIKDKLFSVVSHDIKAPLSSLKLSLALTKLNKLSQEEFQAISTEIESHLDQTTNFIQNLLQWAKFQLRGEKVKPERLNLPEMIAETLGLLEIEIKQKMITIERNIQQDFFAYADPVMIQSVFRNLLTNAIKFSPLGSTITVTGKNEESQVTISVIDSGDGIPVESQEKIFTLESLTTPGTQHEVGTGLGLVLCKEFIEKNKGKIWFETSRGKGTTFHFSLPAYKETLKYA